MSVDNILQRFQVLVDRKDSSDIFPRGLFDLPCFERFDFSSAVHKVKFWNKYITYFKEYILNNLNDGRKFSDHRFTQNIKFHSSNILKTAENSSFSNTFNIVDGNWIDNPRTFNFSQMLELLSILDNEEKAEFITYLCALEFDFTPCGEFEMIADGNNFAHAELHITIRSILECYNPFELNYCLRVLDAIENGDDPYSIGHLKRERDPSDQDMRKEDINNEPDISDDDPMEI